MSINPRCPLLRITVPPIIRTAIILFAALFSGFSAYGQSLPGLQAPEKSKLKDDTPNAVKVVRGEMPFNRIYGHLKLNSARVKRLAQINPSEFKKNKNEKVLRIGVVRPLLTPLDPLVDSSLYPVTEGDIRVAGVASDNALAVRLQFKDMSLPTGARVFVYSASNPDEYYGPYVGGGEANGTFWTPALHGDTIVVEYFNPGKSNLAKLPFQISAVAHIYKDADMPSINDAAESCENEVTQDWQNVAKSVGRIDFVSQGFVGSCTGTLLNNAANDLKPYFLTANHCLSSQTEAQSATIYWNYNTGDEPPGGTPTTHGANLLATGTSSDFTLLFLTGAVPGGLFYSGWDSTAFSGTAPGTGIHHPAGSHKRISFGTAKQPSSGNCPSGLQCFRVDWSSGVTEGGSSGSGLWIGNPSDPGGPRLIGNLTGGVSACGNPSTSMWDVYGRFNITYPNIASFLEGKACATSLSSIGQNFTNSGGTGSFTVTAPGTCNWNAVSSNSFVTVTSGASGTGNGTITFSVASNNGPPRSATIVVGGQTFTVAQAGGGTCAPTPIGFGQTVNGTLTTSSCPLGDGTFYNAYSFPGIAGQQIAVTMTSNDFDAFLILNRPDGSTLAFDDDGGGGLNSRIPAGSGFLTLPVTGAYTIWANAVDPDDATGAYSLTLSTPTPRTLTVASSNPNSGISVQTIPNDNNGLSTGTTQFTRTYNQFTTVTLIAPGTAGDGIIFLKWLRDGADWSSTTVTTVTMDVNHTLTAVYGPTPTFTLTVASNNPSTGVPVTVTPTDKNGAGNGNTQFTRTYNHFTTVSLKAAIDAGNNRYFQKWQQDGVDLTTLRSIDVVMNSNHTLTAVYISLPPPPTPTPTPPPTGPGQAVAYQIDPAHTGSQFDTVSPPLTQLWSRNLGSPTGYPLIAGGKVFVVAGEMLHALNAATGATVWGPINLGTYPSIAYESGRVLAINRNGLLRAFDASNGNQMWSQQLTAQSFTSPPTALGGTVYVNGLSTLFAVSTQNGAVKWLTPGAGGEHSSPAVTTTGLYVSYPCEALALSPSTGNILWQRNSGCFGIGGRTPAYYNGRVYIRNNGLGNVALDAATGTPVAEITAIPAPAFHGSTGFYLNVPTLEARDLSSGALKWSFSGDGTLSTPPIVVNGNVYIGSISGKLYAVNETTGANVWTGNVGAQVNGADEHNAAVPLVGLGAGEGLIVVPASESVVAFQSAPTLPPVIYVEEGTNNAAVLDSVTFLRGPFRLANPFNLSSDGRTRLTIFTSNLGLTQSALSNPGVLVVEASGINLPVENVGPVAIPGLSSSYIVVRLPNNLPPGNYDLRVKLNGSTSAARTLSIAP